MNYIVARFTSPQGIDVINRWICASDELGERHSFKSSDRKSDFFKNCFYWNCVCNGG